MEFAIANVVMTRVESGWSYDEGRTLEDGFYVYPPGEHVESVADAFEAFRRYLDGSADEAP